tara:strand:+ start:257 stop:628 length:372 start_codon:yes stop_codon:yes gene_type:complete
MSTRAQVRFATREEGISFSEHPKVINAQFYVHHDGYPEGLGLEIAESLTKYQKIMHWEIEELFTKHGDLEYIYYIWQHPMKTTWISIFEVGFNANLDPLYDDRDKCIFVGEPSDLISEYKHLR